MKKVIFCIILILMLNVFCIPVVSARVLVDTQMDSNVSELKAGEVVEVGLSFNNFKEINKGINAYRGVLEYDENIFEKVDQDNFVCQNGWEDLEYNPENREFVAIRRVGTKQDGDVVKITLKVKNNIDARKTFVRVKDLVTSEGEKDISLSDTSTSLDIIKEQEVLPSTPDVSIHPSQSSSSHVLSYFSPVGSLVGNKKDINVVDKDSSSIDEKIDSDKGEVSDSKDDSVLGGDLESEVEDSVKIKKTSNYYIIVLLILIVVLFIFLYFRYRRKNNPHNRYMFFIVLGILLTGFTYSTCVFAYNISLKGEVNGDSVISYDDVNLLEKHLIDLKHIAKERVENADMNMDGEITVTDLSLLIQKLENLLEFDVHITNLEVDNYYPNKNQEITIQFHGAVRYGEVIKKVVINGKEIDVQMLDNQTYAIKLNTGKDAGVKDYHITEVVLSNEKRVSVDKELSVNVLKSAPSISNYRVENDINNSKLIVLFDIVDNDNSMSNGYLSVYDKDKNSYMKTELVKGKNRIEVKVEEEKEYLAYIDLQYNLSGVSSDTEHKGVVQYTKALQLLMDYDFKIGNIGLYKDGVLKSEFAKGDNIELVFNSSNNSKYIPSSMKIDGKEYNISIRDNNYVVTLKPFNEVGSHTIKINEVILSNGKRFTLNNQLVTFNVIKRKPNVVLVDVLENSKDNNVEVKLNLEDVDDALEDIQVELLDILGGVISSKSITNKQIEDGKVTCVLDTNGNMSSKYRVVVKTHYRIDDKEVKEEVLARDIDATFKVKVKSVVPNSNYVSKNGHVKLIYDLESNVVGNVTKIRVNNVNYSATRRADGKYEIDVNGIGTSGLYTLVTSKVYYDKVEVDVNNSVSVEVLKDKPSIKNFVFDSDLINSAIVLDFDVVDLESSFISGEVVLKYNGEEVESKKINKNHNKIVFGVIPFQKYTVEIKADYDLDDHLLESRPDDDNRFSDEVIDTREVEFIADYNLELSNIKTYNGIDESKYFNKGDQVRVSFESSNATSLEPIQVSINGKIYDVVKENGVYSAVVDSFDTVGKHVVCIEKVILSNGKELVVDDEVEVEVYVRKDVPRVTNIKASEGDKLDVSFDLVDVDKTIEYLDVDLLNDEDERIDSKRVEKSDIKDVIHTSFTTQMSSKYKVIIKAHYSLDDKDFVDRVLATKEIEALPKVNIKSVTTSSKYVVKNGHVKLTYDLESNRLDDVTRIVVNNVSYPVTKRTDGYYEVEVGVGNTSGVYPLKTTQVVYNESISADAHHVLNIEILKDKPSATNIYTEEKENTLDVRFNLEDVDHVVEYLDLDLFNDKNKKISSKRIEKSQIKELIESTLDTQMSSKYKVVIKAHYSLNGKDFVDDVLLEKEVLARPRVDIRGINASSHYAFKNGFVKITYDFLSNLVEDITRVVVNNISYPVKRLSNGCYEVEVGVGSKEGVYALNTTQVVYADGVEVDVENTLNINILKDVPFINNYRLVDNLEKGTITLDFDVVDNDDSLKNIYAVLDGEVLEEKIVKGHNTLTLKVIPSKKYAFVIQADYDLGDNAVALDKILYTGQIELIEDYQLQVSNIRVLNDQGEADNFEVSEKLKVSFDCRNVTHLEPVQVSINGKVYDVASDNGTYSVIIDSFDTAGSHVVKLEKILLSNGKVFLLDNKNQVEVYVHKRKPSIHNLTTQENDKLDVSFDVEDLDSAIESIDIQLFNDRDEQISSKRIEKDQIKNTIHSSLDTVMSSKYKVRVLVSYNLGGDTVYDEVFEEQEVVASPRVIVRKVDVSNCYVNKKESVNFVYELESNRSEDITKIRINDTDYNVVKLGESKYQVTILDVGSTSGVKNYTASKVIYSDLREAFVRSVVSIDVLKDKPSISNFEIDNDLNTKEVILDFDVVDSEHSFKSGKAVLVNGESQNIKSGHNTLRFKVKPSLKYTLEIKMTYDLDSNKLSGKPDTDNLVTNEVIDTREVMLVSDYKLEVHNIRAYTDESKTTCFGKDEAVNVGFESTNVTDFEPVKAVINGHEYNLLKYNNVYLATIDGIKTVGSHTIKIEKIILSDSAEVEVTKNNETRVNVLKDMPSIENYEVKEDVDNSKLILNFDVVDSDDSISSASLEVDNKNYPLEKGHNRVEVAVDEQVLYKASIKLNYNLSAIDDDDDHKGVVAYDKDLQLLVDYNFSLSNIKIYKDGKEVGSLSKDEQAQLVFDSTNNTKHIPSTIKVGNKEYSVAYENNHYVAELDHFTTLGSNTIRIDEVTLSNGKKFKLSENNFVTVQVNKRKPVISDELTITEHIESNDLKVMFNLEDSDKALLDLSIILMNAEDREIRRVSLTKDEILKAGIINKLLKTEMTSKYKVKIVASYNLGGDTIYDEVFKEQEVVASPRVIVKNIEASSDYVNKNSGVDIIYELLSNRVENITKININNTDYNVVKLNDSKYQVTILDVGSTSGVKTYTANKVIYSDGREARVNQSISIDVLKNKPSISNFVLDNDLDSEEVILDFDVIDKEDSFKAGKAVLVNGESQNINSGHNTLRFKVKPKQKYTLEIKATYDLDSNKLSGRPTTDNLVLDEVIDTREVMLVSDYNLDIQNIKTHNEKKETKYFGKEEAVTVSFESTNTTELEPVKVVVNNKEYELTKKDNRYYFTINSYKEPGVKLANIEKIILNNTKEITLTGKVIQVTVLKDKPVVDKFTSTENSDGTVSAKFNLIDSENAITAGKVVVLNKGTIIKEQNVVKNENIISFVASANQNYTVRIIVDYDLDMNMLEQGANEYKNIVLLETEITLGNRKFEMKDITNTTVYKQTGDGVVEVSSLREADLKDLSPYIVKVDMKNMPTFYTTITGYKVEDKKLKLILDYDNVVQYTSNSKKDSLEITYGSMVNGVAENVSLESLIKSMEENPDGEFTLNRDYDASLLSGNTNTLITEKFSGILNGNGHKIINLNKPFFNELDGATIKNMVFLDVTLSGASRGSIANISKDTLITNVHISHLNYKTGADKSGGIVGEAVSTNIEKSSVTDLNMATSHGRIGGIAGQMTGGSIKNCYTEGVISSTHSKDGSGTSGILGTGEAATLIAIENCITKISFTSNTGHRLNGGVIGLALSANTTLKNNVSLSTGEGHYAVHGYNVHATSINNYELSSTTLTSNASGEVVKKISKDKINSKFYKDIAKFDETIWDLTKTSYDKLPVLKNDDPNALESEENSNIYIPDYSRIKKISAYTSAKDILYHNLYKLMPYYDAKYLVEDGVKFSSDHILATKVIRHILPYSNGKLLTYLTSENYNTITDIKVVFDDLKIQNFKVNFKGLNQNITIYGVDGLGIDYAPSKYVIKNDSEVVNTVKAYIEGVDYAGVLDPLTETADARHYKDHYNEVIKTSALNIALQLLQNDPESVLTINNSVLNEKIKKNLIDSGRLNRIIYAYNYYYKWYNFEIGGAKVSDILLFENQMFKDSNNFENLVNEVFVGNMAVNATDGFFRNNVGKYTGSSTIQYFLDYIITNIGGYSDVNDWFTEYFGSRNFLAEFGVDNRPELLYRGWYQLKKTSRMILPIINMPLDSTYLISGPAHLQIGPSQLYHKNPNTDVGKAEIRKTINNHVTLAKRHFTTLAGGFGSLKWNNYCIMVYDCTKIITGYRESYITIGGVKIPTGKIVPIYTQGRVGTNYPFFKNFSEVFGLWQPAGSSGGVGNTAGFLWFQAQPGLTNFDTWTHEFEHALYDKIMLDQRGFRTRMEVMTQGNVEQRDDWSINNLNQDVGPYYFNTSFYLSKEGNATQNLTPERINTKEKMENYFKGQQNALDLLDYIEGKAFIRLTPEQQAKIATRVASANEKTAWGTITAEQATNMNLTSLESLYDNQIILRPPNAWGASVRGLVMPTSTIADNYGYESVWVNRWYIDHYDSRFAGAFGTKRNFFEMLGYAGVEGYIIYGSARSGNDLDAIRKITQLVTGKAMNWKEYKMSRYATVEENLSNNKYIDVQYMIERFTEALKNDAARGDRNVSQRTNLRKIYYHYLKSATNDFVDDPLGTTVEAIHIKTAEELVQKINAKPYGYYVLDNDIDFSNMTRNVTQTFMGRLDGNGHKIIGNKFPIFNKIRYGYVGNIVFENTNIPINIANAGALSYRAEMSTIEKITANNLQMNFGGRNDLSLISGAVSNVITRDCNVEKLTHHISSADDFSLLNEDSGGMFIIDNDIDFAGKTYNGVVVSNTFTGKINGQGHTLSNLTNASLFANFRGTVENINIKSFTNTSVGRGSGDFVTAFTQESFTATFRNMRFDNITLSGRNNVSVLTGMDGRDNANSVFENISVRNANVTGTGVYVSTLIGRKYGGKISNVFVQGSLTINSTENGGLLGASQQNPVIENVVTDVDITKPSNNYSNIANSVFNGSMIGNIYNTPSIKNSIAFGNMSGYTATDGTKYIPFKFTGALEAQVIASMTNCYEVLEEIGSSRASDNTNGKLNSISRKDLNKQFYKNLGFDESIWDLDHLSSKGYPSLR